MRSFTNKQGERIDVSEAHLKMAVKIKDELQKSSPSKKCAWNKHKTMMEIEGFFNSDTNESYRCMIKAYQKSIGELPELPKYADMVSEGKLESIREAVGEIAYEKRFAQNEYRKLNKLKREVIDFSLLAEQIEKAYANYDWSKIEFTYEPIKKSKKKMIVALSDLHIGALVDTDINKYNFEIAKARMQEYLNKVLEEVEKNNISEVYLINLGDSIEHPYMHNLAYNCEFVLSEQIAHASDLIIKFMIGLAEKVNVTVAGIAGNHDRLNENKNSNLDGDHAVKGINKSITSFIENAKPKRITYEQAKDYEHSTTINGLNVKFIHGDLDNKNDGNLLSKHSSLDNTNYNLVLMGHYHTVEVKEVGIGKFIVVSGSLKGADNYSVNKIRKVSSPSQSYIIIDENGEVEIKWATLK
jgi:predicted phosphodiesterase